MKKQRENSSQKTNQMRKKGEVFLDLPDQAPDQPREERLLPEMPEESFRKTFIVEISNLSNATWQGKVIWADERKTQYFRSALELIRLMDKVVSGQDMNA